MAIRLSLVEVSPKENELPFGKFSYIVVSNFNIRQNDDRPCVSFECHSQKELEECIDILKSDLEEIRKKGMKFFKK